jgi:hypothetical protein
MFYIVCGRNIGLGIYASMEDAFQSVVDQWRGSFMLIHERSDVFVRMDVGEGGDEITITACVLLFAPAPLLRS